MSDSAGSNYINVEEHRPHDAQSEMLCFDSSRCVSGPPGSESWSGSFLTNGHLDVRLLDQNLSFITAYYQSGTEPGPPLLNTLYTYQYVHVLTLGMNRGCIESAADVVWREGKISTA